MLKVRRSEFTKRSAESFSKPTKFNTKPLCWWFVEPNQDQYSGAKSNRLYQALPNPKHQEKLLFGIHEIHWTPFFNQVWGRQRQNRHKAVMAQVIGFMKMGQPKIWRKVQGRSWSAVSIIENERPVEPEIPVRQVHGCHHWLLELKIC